MKHKGGFYHDGLLYGDEPTEVPSAPCAYLVMTGVTESFSGSVDSIWTDIERAHARRHELIQEGAGCDEGNVEVWSEERMAQAVERITTASSRPSIAIIAVSSRSLRFVSHAPLKRD